MFPTTVASKREREMPKHESAVVRHRKPVRVTAKAKAPAQAAPASLEFQKLLTIFNMMVGRTQSGRALTSSRLSGGKHG
jgi:hypothetical protein